MEEIESNSYKVGDANKIEDTNEDTNEEIKDEKEKKKKPVSKLDKKLKDLNKRYGKGIIQSGETNEFDGQVVSTGSFTLDIATGVGGVPLGRIVEVIGSESTGKTSVAINIVANAQKKGHKCAYIDMEQALDNKYCKALGMNMDEVLISQPDYGEQALNIAKELIETGEVQVIIIDSVSALTPKSEMEGEVGDASIGKQARMMSQALRLITPLAKRNNTLVVFLNQYREKIGIMFGDNRVGSGGNALKFYSSLRIETRKKVDRQEEKNITKAKVIKNKVSKPFQEAEFGLLWGIGIDRIGEIVTLAVDNDIIQKSGSWYSYEGSKIGQGDKKVREFLIDNPEVNNKIEEQIKNIIYNN